MRGLIRLVCVCLVATATAARADPVDASTAGARSDRSQEELRSALRAFQDFDSVSAKQQLRELIQHGPTARIAATARLYLGLIALNDLDQTGAEREFEQALRVDVLVELPHNQSPKAELLFSRVRQQMLTQSPPPAPAPALRSTAAPAASGLTEAASLPAASAPSRAPCYVVAAVAVLALGTAIGFGALQQSALSAARAAGSGAAAQSDASQWSTDGAVADILFGVAAVAAGTSVWLFFAEAPPSGAKSASPAQGVVGLGGRF